MPANFDAATRKLLDGENFATVATINPDGSPQTSVVWFKRDGDTVVFSTTETRRKARNIARDPRVSISVFDLANPYHSVDIRGLAETTVDAEKVLPQELSHKYLGQDPPVDEPDDVVRLVVRVVPERITTFSAGTTE